MQPKEILVLEGLTFGYADAPLFEDLDLDFLEGSIVLLRGNNGTGKTTLCGHRGGRTQGRCATLPVAR